MNIWIIIAAHSGILFEIPALALVLFWIERRISRRVVLTMAAFFVFRLIGELLKNGLGLPRPCWNPSFPSSIPCPDTFSFPSGHALGAAMAGMISGLALRRPAVGGAALLLTLIIAASRVIVGVHTVADVGGGIMLGILFGYLTWRVYWRDR